MRLVKDYLSGSKEAADERGDELGLFEFEARNLYSALFAVEFLVDVTTASIIAVNGFVLSKNAVSYTQLVEPVEPTDGDDSEEEECVHPVANIVLRDEIAKCTKCGVEGNLFPEDLRGCFIPCHETEVTGRRAAIEATNLKKGDE